MSIETKYPGLEDLRNRAKARLPKFVWEYLDSATGREGTKARNRAALDQVMLMPSILHGPLEFDTSRTLMGQRYDLPFGAGPVGMSGLIWPQAERHIARAMTGAGGLPFGLSTVATMAPEELSGDIAGNGWFQLYPPKDEGIRRDMLARVWDAGFHTLVLTVDVPVASRRERQTRSGMTHPPRLTARLLAQVAMRPAWALATARSGMPQMPFVQSYGKAQKGMSTTAHVGYMLRTSPDMDYVHWLRDHWQGKLVVKGVLNPADIAPLEGTGVDAYWVSNHAGRQFDGAPAAIQQLPLIRAQTQKPIIFDSGIEGGLDILRALALGADFVMLASAWHYAVAALGPQGPAYLVELLRKDIESNMGQLGLANLDDVPRVLIP